MDQISALGLRHVGDLVGAKHFFVEGGCLGFSGAWS